MLVCQSVLTLSRCSKAGGVGPHGAASRGVRNLKSEQRPSLTKICNAQRLIRVKFSLALVTGSGR